MLGFLVCVLTDCVGHDTLLVESPRQKLSIFFVKKPEAKECILVHNDPNMKFCFVCHWQWAEDESHTQLWPDKTFSHLNWWQCVQLLSTGWSMHLLIISFHVFCLSGTKFFYLLKEVLMLGARGLMTSRDLSLSLSLLALLLWCHCAADGASLFELKWFCIQTAVLPSNHQQRETLPCE